MMKPENILLAAGALASVGIGGYFLWKKYKSTSAAATSSAPSFQSTVGTKIASPLNTTGRGNTTVETLATRLKNSASINTTTTAYADTAKPAYAADPVYQPLTMTDGKGGEQMAIAGLGYYN